MSYHSQHELLKTVQRLLEDCCYDWAVQWIPAVLEEQGWSCSEAVELSTWTATIPQRFDAFSFDATTLGSREALTAVFAATHSLRHAAVHRLRTSVKGIERMLKHAVNLATALQDTERQSTLHGILKELRNTMQTMELDKNDLENQLDEELRNIQEKRAALDRMEQEAMLNMLQQDQENTARISSLFERSIRNLTSIDESSATSMEQDNARGSESGEAFDEVITGDIPDKHSAEGSHPTIDENGWAYPDSKPSKHGKVRAAKGVPTSQGVDDNQHGTADASIGNSDSKPSNQGDSGVGTADSREFITPRIEDDDSKVSSQYTGQYIARDFALA